MNNTGWTIIGIVLDILSLILVFLPFMVLELGIKPYQRGFYCNDNSIRYPYKSDTVTTLVLTLVGLLVPLAVVIITEVIRTLHQKKYFLTPAPYRLTATCSIPYFVVCSYQVIGIFLFGAAITQSATNIGKFTIGRLRPHFLAVCQPNATQYKCTDENNIFLYVENFVCYGTDDHLLLDARLSFPSGHSSMAAYCAIFLVFYLQARFTWKQSKLLKHFLQAICIYGAIFVCLSRISDYKHHWSDVLSGAILGSFIASLTSLHIFNMFKMKEQRSHPQNNDGTSSVFMLSSQTQNDSQTRVPQVTVNV